MLFKRWGIFIQRSTARPPRREDLEGMVRFTWQSSELDEGKTSFVFLAKNHKNI
jgi:hypothetical protein